MSIVAGIDIGNSTTEVVLARLQHRSADIIGTARSQTRRHKGSPESIDGAAALVTRLEHAHGARIERAVAANVRPITTLTASLPEPLEPTGRLRIVSAGSPTAGGHGFAAGRPYRLGDPAGLPGGPLVAVVPAGFGYQAAADQLRELPSLVAVMLEDDEAVLVSNRLGCALPVIDEINADAVLSASVVAVEVAGPGGVLRGLTDPLRLLSAFGLDGSDRSSAARIAAQLGDCSSAAIALTTTSDTTVPAMQAWVEFGDGRRETFPAAHRLLVEGPAGSARRFAVPGAEQAVDDLWAVDLASVADTALARRPSTGSRAIALAALTAQAPLTDPSPALAERLGVPVMAGDEDQAAWRGGCSTPGTDAAGTVVIDVGGGTIDVVSLSRAVAVAGAGQLLTAAVAALTGTSQAGAEWAKRTAAHRVEAPQVLLGEDGSRSFLDRPAPAATIGALVVSGPAGLLPFSRVLAPGEWRALRLRLKVEALGLNVTRALRTLDVGPGTVIVTGGPAGDDEVLSVIARALPPGVAVARGDVAGQLGHRYAVAYGLLGLLSGQMPSRAAGDSGST